MATNSGAASGRIPRGNSALTNEVQGATPRMNLKYKDLVLGYYKGVLANRKVFVCVQRITSVGSTVNVFGFSYIRRAHNSTWIPWVGSGEEDDASDFRRTVTPAEVVNEGTPPLPQNVSALTPRPLPKRVAREDGSPRETVPGNATSPVCLRCKAPTIEVVLFSSTSRICKACE
jgi:hypothetical protein